MKKIYPAGIKSKKVFVSVIIAVLGLALMFILLFAGPKAQRKSQVVNLPGVEFEVVNPASVSIPVFTRGIANPSTQVDLSSEVTGVVVEISENFKNGGYFKKDDWLIKVDQSHHLMEMDTAKAEYASADLNYQRTRANLNSRGRSSRRLTDYAKGKPQLAEAESRMRAARTRLKLAREQLSKTTIKAPFDGRVQVTQVAIKEYITTGRPIAKIYAINQSEVRLPLSRQQLKLVEVPGLYLNSDVDDSDVQKEALPKVKVMDSSHQYHWQGRLVRSEGNVDPRNRLIYVIAEIVAPYASDPEQPERPPLSAGTFVEARIEGRAHENIVEIPRAALHNRDEVWLLNSDDRIEIRKVNVLYRGKDKVYLNKGLNQGDKVITTPLEVAVNNMRVQVTADSDEPEANEVSTKDRSLIPMNWMQMKRLNPPLKSQLIKLMQDSVL